MNAIAGPVYTIQPERVSELQHARVLRAMSEVVAESGLRAATITAVTRRASVSHATFKDLFGGFDACFVVLVGEIVDHALSLICSAFTREKTWRDGVLAGLEAALVFLDAEPRLAHVCLIEMPAGPHGATQHGARFLVRLSKLLDGVRNGMPSGGQPPMITAEATILSVTGILRARLSSGDAPPFILLLSDLAGLVVGSYLGWAAAVEVVQLGLERTEVATKGHLSCGGASSVLPRQVARANAYRARAAVLHIADHACASNKDIATALGVAHPGQISSLLSRLEQGGLVAKLPCKPGGPNAWILTRYGEEVARILETSLAAGGLQSEQPRSAGRKQ